MVLIKSGFSIEQCSKPGWLFDLGDYTTQLYGDCNKPIQDYATHLYGDYNKPIYIYIIFIRIP